MDVAEVARRRLLGLGLAGEGPWAGLGVAGAVRRLGAVQAQDYGPALWSLGQRTGLAEAGVEAPVLAGDVVRTHVLRPTWHFVPAEDLGWMQALTAPRVHAVNAHYYRRSGLDEQQLERSRRVIEDAVGEGGEQTRAQLSAALVGAGLDVGDLRLTLMVMNAELSATVCSGVRRGRQQTYALVGDRVRAPRELDPDAALAELTWRYASSHGPAAVADLAWWSSLRRADVERGLALVGDRLRRDELAGVPVWSPAEGTRPASGIPAGGLPVVTLAQAYDEYVVGYTRTKHVLDVAGLAAARPPGATVRTAHLLVDGQVTGFWRRVAGTRAVTVEVTAHRGLTATEAAGLEAEAARLGAFLGLPARLAVQEAG